MRVDFVAFRAYAEAVYGATDEYREGLYLSYYFINGYQVIKRKFV